MVLLRPGMVAICWWFAGVGLLLFAGDAGCLLCIGCCVDCGL